MKNKTFARVNGSLAIFYGIACIVGAIGGLVGIIIGSYEVITQQADFTWWIFIFLTIITIVLGLMGYILLRVGYEEIEK